MNEDAPVYLFRRGGFAAALNTVVCVAPREIVASALGGGGNKDTDCLIAAFGAAEVFEDEETGRYFIGVWGSRGASRLRSALRRAGISLKIVREPCPGRLKYTFKSRERPPRTGQGAAWKGGGA
jgi:hypothetical protein